MRTNSACEPGGWKYRQFNGWQPSRAWGENDFLQWGKSRSGYFIELYLEVLGTFYRVEGDSLDAAEAKAWDQYGEYLACPHLEWEKRGYTNGLGFCTKCGMSRSKQFPDETPPLTPEQEESIRKMKEFMDRPDSDELVAEALPEVMKRILGGLRDGREEPAGG